MQQSGGHVVLASSRGHGTAVRLRFPRLQPVPAVPARALAPGRPRVLVVDDEPAVRRVLARLLERDGLDVIEAGSSVEALAALDATAFDLLVTDVVLGAGQSGAVLGRAARARRPGLPILYVSGYTRAELDLADLEEGEAFVAKPIALAALRAAVEAAIAPVRARAAAVSAGPAR